MKARTLVTVGLLAVYTVNWIPQVALAGCGYGNNFRRVRSNFSNGYHSNFLQNEIQLRGYNAQYILFEVQPYRYTYSSYYAAPPIAVPVTAQVRTTAARTTQPTGGQYLTTQEFQKSMTLLISSINNNTQATQKLVASFTATGQPPRATQRPVTNPEQDEQDPNPVRPEPDLPPAPDDQDEIGVGLRDVQVILQQRCASCHTGANSEGNFVMFDNGALQADTLSFDRIAVRMATGSMPPPKVQDRPTQEEISKIIFFADNYEPQVQPY